MYLARLETRPESYTRTDKLKREWGCQEESKQCVDPRPEERTDGVLEGKNEMTQGDPPISLCDDKTRNKKYFASTRTRIPKRVEFISRSE